MNTREIDRMIACYLDGAMSLEEEEDFFVRMALDSDLRQSYQAQRVVESALRKQRQAAPRPALENRSRLLHAIAVASGVENVGEMSQTDGGANAVGRRNRPDTTERRNAQGGSKSESTPVDRRGPGMSASGRMVIQRVIRAVAATVSIGAAVTAIVMFSDGQPPSPPPVPVDSVEAESAPTTTPPARPADSLIEVGPAVTGAANTPAHTSEAELSRSPNVSRSVYPDRDDRPVQTTVNTETAPSVDTSRTSLSRPPLADTIAASPRGATVSSPSSERVDTIKLNVRVKMPD